MRIPSQTTRVVFCFVVLAISALAHAAAQADLPGALASAATAVNALAGLCLVLLAPGLVYMPLWRRLEWIPERPNVFYGLVATALSTVACHGVNHKLIVWSGYLADYWPLWSGAVAFAIVGAVASARWGRPVEIAWPRKAVVWTSVAGAAAVVAFAIATTPPRFVEEINYWPDKVYSDFAKLDFGHEDLGRAGIEVVFGPSWIERGHGRYDLKGDAGAIRLVNHNRVPYPLGLKFVLQNRWREPLAAHVWLDDKVLGEEAMEPYKRQRFSHSRTAPEDFVPLAPVFDHSRDPRDRPMHLCLVAPTLRLTPGEHLLRMRVDAPGQYREPGPRLTLVDMSNLDARGFYRRLTRHFFIGDTSDIYETLDFARNFRGHWIQHSSSFNGTQFDGGGATSINDEPPGHHFLCFLALSFIRDSITSISLLFLVELALVFALVVHLASWDNPSFRWWHALPILGVAFAYTRLCRLGTESNAPDTLFLLVWLGAMKAYLDGRPRLASWLVGVDFLIHVPTPHSVVLLGAASWLVRPNRAALKFVGRAFLVMLFLAVARVLLISTEAGFRGALFTAQGRYGGVRRMELLREIILRGHWMRALDLFRVARGFTRLVLIASCGAIPIFAVSLAFKVRGGDGKVDEKTGVLFLFGVLYYLAMSLLDTQRAHHVGPMAFPLIAATVRRLSQIDRALIRRALMAGLVAACVGAVGFLLVAGPDYTGTFTRFPIYALTHPSSRRGYGFNPFF